MQVLEHFVFIFHTAAALDASRSDAHPRVPVMNPHGRVSSYASVQRQTAVTAYFSSKELLLFAFAPQQNNAFSHISEISSSREQFFCVWRYDHILSEIVK